MALVVEGYKSRQLRQDDCVITDITSLYTACKDQRTRKRTRK